ncbi:MAG: hypothetical protein QN229_00505 [Desulfurococcaceae archaeon TW002]
MSEEEKRTEEEEETEEESFEKMINLETTEEEVSWGAEEVEVPKISFSINSLETMISIEELLLKALNNPDAVDEVVNNIKKLRENFLSKQKKKEQKTKTSRKSKK